MNGPEHHAEAERLIASISNQDLHVGIISAAMATAQVHATLALADFFRAWTEAQA